MERMPSKIMTNTNLFHKGCLFAAFVLLFVVATHAQKDGKDALVKVLTYTNVDINQNLDSAGLAKVLAKQYSLATYLYNTTPIDSLTKEDKRFIDSIQLYITKRYVAEKALERKIAAIKVSDEDALAYYNTHKDAYTVIGKATYILAYILNENPTTIEKAKKQMLAAAANPDSLSQTGSLKNSEYSISVEKNALLSSNVQLTKYIAPLKAKQMSDLLEIPGYNSKLLLYIVSKPDNGHLSFQEVKEDCRSRAKAEKTETMLQQLMKNAEATYPAPSK